MVDWGRSALGLDPIPGRKTSQRLAELQFRTMQAHLKRAIPETER